MNCFLYLIEFQIRKNLSTISFANEEFEDRPDDRKEVQATGSIQFSIYKTFLRSAHSSFFVFIVLILFVASQFAWNGSDFFLSIW